MSEQSSPGSSPPSPGNPSSRSPQLLPVAFLVPLVVAVAGGFGAGLLIVRFGMIGGVVLWGAGALGGYVARRIIQAPYPPVAWSLVVACVLAFAIAEVSWYRWSVTLPDENGGRRDPTWPEAVTRAPNYLLQNGQIGLFVGALFAGFGGHSAYLQAGRRYRLVAVAEDS